LVTSVFAGTDAEAKGVSIGDSIVAVDDQALAQLGPVAAHALLSGPVGSQKMVQFGSAATLSNQTVALLVEDLLPP
jgi:C-terminal processing protease CtpA/Prc